MKLFPTKFIIRHQARLLFVVFWAHITILDLFYVTYVGPIFFWEKSIQPYTLFIHLSVATLTLVFYFLLVTMMTRLKNKHKTHHSNSLSSEHDLDTSSENTLENRPPNGSFK